eukprot:scaffold10220_cov144-Isochrysis_galbana.AAC.9
MGIEWEGRGGVTGRQWTVVSRRAAASVSRSTRQKRTRTPCMHMHTDRQAAAAGTQHPADRGTPRSQPPHPLPHHKELEMAAWLPIYSSAIDKSPNWEVRASTDWERWKRLRRSRPKKPTEALNWPRIGVQRA